MTDHEPPSTVSLFAGRYELRSRRGTGFDAAVFDAFDTVQQRQVAVKLIHPELSGDAIEVQFRDAMATMAATHHPNISAVYDWGRASWNDHDILFVAVEHLGGGSVRELLDRGRKLSPSQAVIVGLEACKALDAIHRHGMVHGDIRPSTLVFGEDRRLRVIDVGLAPLLAEGMWKDRAHIGVERAMYASPELAEHGTMTAKGDVYSLCLTLLETVTGQVPFVGDSAVATLNNRIGKLLPVSADLGPLASVLERAARPDEASRCTAAEFGAALVQVASKLPRPEPIAILGATSVAPGPLVGETVDPTGPVRRQPSPVEPMQASGAVPNDVAPNDLAPAVKPGAALPPPVAATMGVAPAPPAPAAAAAPTVLSGAVPTAPQTAPPPAVPWSESAPADALSRRWPIILGVVAAVLVGLTAFWITQRDSGTEVPELVGLEIGEALNQVSGIGWDTEVIEEMSDTVDAGRVISTDPAAGETLADDGTITLVVSAGRAPQPLPDLVGLTLEAATEALADAGLVLEVGDPVFDESIPAGVVVSWSVPEQPMLQAGDTVTVGTVVRVVVSGGPEPRAVPDLTNLTADEARAAVESLGLVLVLLPDEFSDSVPVGVVARQEPAVGESIERGGSVSIAISKGPDVVAIPPLGGLTLAEATAALEQVGLRVGTVSGDPAGVNTLSTYQGVSLVANQLLPRGAAVDLTFTVPTP